MTNSHPRLVKNNFDLLRFLFATVVFFVHSSVLSGFEELSFITPILSSDIAVKAFFVISGFLIFMSYERSSSLLHIQENVLGVSTQPISQ